MWMTAWSISADQTPPLNCWSREYTKAWLTPSWLPDERKCLESAHVSWTLSQGRIRVLLWTEEDVERAERSPASEQPCKQRKLVYVLRGVDADRTPCPRGASRGHCLCRWFWLPAFWFNQDNSVPSCKLYLVGKGLDRYTYTVSLSWSALFSH